jgi:hypothetical protein
MERKSVKIVLMLGIGKLPEMRLEIKPSGLFKKECGLEVVFSEFAL